MAAYYQVLDHTADVGLLCQAESLSALFRVAAQGMMSLLIAGEIQCREETVVKLSAPDLAGLLQVWLSEINYRLEVEQKVWSTFEISSIDEQNLQAVCRGESFDPQRHEYLTEIKAVTYHRLKVEKKSAGWEAQVIFDL